ncbi:MAG TPA: type VII secretion-associated serine protease mycosin [Micromonosporaceae bacterium]|nr:type VII secretion-associated serine protease mycosin [Micromonosporaceae bacterium]
MSAAGSAAALAVPAGALAAPASVLARPATTAPTFERVPAPRYDSVRDEQWQLRELDAEDAWKVSKGRGVTVAVIDSGVDATHPDLSGQVLPGIDLVRRAGDGRVDPVGHGTTVAALIAGRADDGRGVAGLAPRAKILPVRVLDEENRYDDALVVANGVRWAVDHGAKVINLSLGGAGDSPALAAALDYAFVRDVVVVACTGNQSESAPTGVWYPAREPGVLAVAGLQRESDALWTGSITGGQTVLTAPATELLGAHPEGYWRVQGTSFAAPLVTATVALVRSRWPAMSAGDVVNRIISTAHDLGPGGRDDRFGFGRIDPVAALTADVTPVGRNPLDDGAAPGVSGFGRASGPGETNASPGTAPDQSDDGPQVPAKSWAVRPAGSPAEHTPTDKWDEGALLLVVLAGGTVLVRRVGRGSLPQVRQRDKREARANRYR